MSINFNRGIRRPQEPNTGGVSTAIGGVLDPVAQAAQSVATPATTPAPNAAVDLAGGVAGGVQPPPSPASPRSFSGFEPQSLQGLLGGVRTNIIDRLLRNQGVQLGQNGIQRVGMS